jgi:hypothetical protein
MTPGNAIREQESVEPPLSAPTDRLAATVIPARWEISVRRGFVTEELCPIWTVTPTSTLSAEGMIAVTRTLRSGRLPVK